MKKHTLIALLLLCSLITGAQQTKVYQLKSPNGTVSVNVEAAARMQWSVYCSGQQIIAPSAIALQLQNGDVLGENAKVQSAKTTSINSSFTAVNYRRDVVKDHYNQLTITCKGGYGIIFRAYDDAVAYRFFTQRKGEIIVLNETANFNFSSDHQAFIPIQWDYRGGQMFNSSFEALYREINLSQFPKDSLAFLPVLIDVGQGMRALITEADLEDYPGMYLDLNSTGKGFKGVFAPYPLETILGGYGNINVIPVKRADYIAKTSGSRSFPWRAVVISKNDKDLLNCDIVQKLASPGRIADISWIKAGQVAWDWWNDWNISHVDFRAGINTPTYKYYIDFAADNKIPYVILDAGWTTEADLTVPVAEINLEELVAYGKQKNVDLILWASWHAVTQQKAKAFPLFEKLGIKGLKIDFIDRDDQLAVASLYEIAREAADHHLLVDYHGVFKPTGLQRTYPNVVGFEGVRGMENVKWADEDVPRYDVTLPFIRNLAGPMDYTPGAMRNSTQANFKPNNSMPMSKGTRVHQMAMYVVFEVPLQMLSDNPTIYRKEQECTGFITKIPTTFDETIPLDGKVAEFVSVARRKGDTWFVGAMTNWTPRELTMDFSFLPEGSYQAEIFRDGVNADRDATDYKKEVIQIKSGDKLPVKLMDGGGWVARIVKE
ncbi:MAG: glycoside hydrolase family 97 protein [Bacteroidales bacterium]